MHFTDAWAIRERDHDIQNPLSPAKLALLADYCRVRDGLRVLDVGCGKGVLLRTWAQQWAIDGTGLKLTRTSLPQHVSKPPRGVSQSACGLRKEQRLISGPNRQAMTSLCASVHRLRLVDLTRPYGGCDAH